MGLIKKHAPKTGWCAVIIKFYKKEDTDHHRMQAYKKAWKYLLELKPDYVNMSGGGGTAFSEESDAITTLVNTKFICSVGNDGMDLRKKQNEFYPAKYTYKNIIPVGATDKKGNKLKTNNYGLAYIRYEIGENVVSTLPGGIDGYMTGSSMSTAIATGKIIKQDLKSTNK
jgi:Subtilase family